MLALLISGAYKNNALSQKSKESLEIIRKRLASYEPTNDVDSTQPTQKPLESLIDKVHDAIQTGSFNDAEYHISCFNPIDVASIDDTFDRKTVLQILLEKGGEWDYDANPSSTNRYYDLAKSIRAKGANPSELRKESLSALLLAAVKQNDLGIVNIILSSKKFSYDEHATKALKAANPLEQVDIIVAIEAKEPAPVYVGTAPVMPVHRSALTKYRLAATSILEMKATNDGGSHDNNISDSNDDNQAAAGDEDENGFVIVSSSVDAAAVITQTPTVDDTSCSAVKELDTLKLYFRTMRTDEEPENTATVLPELNRTARL